MILDALLALGIVMSSATQILIPGLPLTIGEFSLLVWIILSLGRIIAGEQVIVTPALVRLAGFWVALALLLCVGAFMGYLTKVLQPSYVIHDTIAYALLALLTCLAAARPNASHHLRHCAWFVIACANASLAIQLGQGWGLFHVSSVNPWFWDRFRGWSANPNQLALYCTMYGPIALHLATTSKKTFAKIVGYMGLILPYYVGWMTKSDTFVLSTILTSFIFLGLRLRTWLSSGGSKAAIGRQIAILLLFVSVPLGLALVPYSTTEVDVAALIAKNLTRDQDGKGIEANTARRRQLWNEAIENGLQSASLGLGPGPHQVIRPLNEPSTDPPPFEAHNTYLDIYTQGGLMAVLLLFWIVGSAAAFVWRAKLDALFALALSLALFANTHMIIRHPVVWFAVTLCLATGSARVVSSIPARRRVTPCMK